MDVIIDKRISKPKEYSFNSIEDVKEASKNLPYNDEGYIVLDGNYNRVKIKSPAYVAAHHLASSMTASPRNVLEIILSGEEEEIIANFPHLKEYITNVRNIYWIYVNKINDEINEIQFTSIHDLSPNKKFRDMSQKEYAIYVKDKTEPAVLFKLRNNDYKFDYKDLVDYFKSKPIKHLSKKLRLE